MLKKLKRFWVYNRVKIKNGTGFLLCLVGIGLIIKMLPIWIMGVLIGGGSIFTGVELLRKWDNIHSFKIEYNF